VGRWCPSAPPTAEAVPAATVRQVVPVVPDDPDDPAVDAAIRAALGAVPPAAWEELDAALAAVEALDPDRYATWTGGGEQPDGTVTLAWPDYAPEVERLRSAIGAAGLVVPYAWPQWAGIERHRAGRGMEEALVEDAVRMVTAVVRSERFGDGNIEGALRDGTLQAAVRRALAWPADQAG
jgi:hypothetical protein